MRADPVSIGIAYRTASRIPVGEDGISYGFKKAPIDQPRVKVVKDIPEEKLWTVDHRSIIELKKDATQDSEEDIEDDDYDARDSEPGYEELGYAPVVKYKIAKRPKKLDFELKPLKEKNRSDEDQSKLDDELIVYRRGKIVTDVSREADDSYSSSEAVCCRRDYDE